MQFTGTDVNTYGDSVVASLDIPVDEVKSIVIRQMGETIVQLTLAAKPISTVRNIQLREGTCVMQPFCDHFSDGPHRIVGWTFEAE